MGAPRTIHHSASVGSVAAGLLSGLMMLACVIWTSLENASSQSDWVFPRPYGDKNVVVSQKGDTQASELVNNLVNVLFEQQITAPVRRTDLGNTTIGQPGAITISPTAFGIPHGNRAGLRAKAAVFPCLAPVARMLVP